MSAQLFAAIGAAAANHIGTMMTALGQKAPAYAGDVNLSDALSAGLNGNINNSPLMEMLSRNINYSNQAENLKMLEQANPGFSDWSKQMSSQAQDYASGGINAAQLADIQRKSAESSYSSGIRGQAANFGFARNLGLAQFNNTNQSTNIMQSLEGLSKVNLSGIGNFYSTAQDAIHTAMANKQAEQAYLNAKQASDNVRKNALWGAVSTAGTSLATTMGGSGQGADFNAYKTYNDMGYTNDNGYSNNTY